MIKGNFTKFIKLEYTGKPDFLYRSNFETETAIFKKEKVLINAINGVSYTVNNDLNYTVSFPNDLLDSESYESVFICSIIWKVNPIQLNIHEKYGTASSYISLFLVDTFNGVIEINSKVEGKLILNTFIIYCCLIWLLL